MENSRTPLVSILIPLYNQERYFDKCMRSVCGQTYKNLEIIVINDGSTDRSPEIAQQWAARDSRIKYISKKNAGAAMARWTGYRHATGDYITPVDSDDILPKNAIEILAGYMTEKNVDIVQGSMSWMLGFIKRDHYYDVGTFPFHQVVKQPELFDKYYLNFFGKGYFTIMMCSKLYRKSVIDNAMKETKLCSHDFPFVGEDHFFNLKLFPYVRSMYRTEETVYYYRYGGGSSNRFSPSYPSLFTLADIRLDLLDHYQLDEGYDPLFRSYADTVYYHAQQLLYFKKGEKDEVIAFLKKEFSTRRIIPRMIEYYTPDKDMSERIRLMVNRDFEGMYRLVEQLVYNSRYSLKGKLRNFVMNVLSKF